MSCLATGVGGRSRASRFGPLEGALPGRNLLPGELRRIFLRAYACLALASQSMNKKL